MALAPRTGAITMRMRGVPRRSGGRVPPPVPSATPASPIPVPTRTPAADRRASTAATLDAMRRIVRALRVAAGSTEAATGLTAAQLFVLQAVHAEPGHSLTGIAARTMTDVRSWTG